MYVRIFVAGEADVTELADFFRIEQGGVRAVVVEDAVGVFQTSGLDLLVIENTVFVKDPKYQLVTRKIRREEAVLA